PPRGGGRPADDEEAFDPILTEEIEGELPEHSPRRASIYRQILNMSVPQKIRLAMLGNKEARAILVRDSNKQVCGAVIRSPRLTETEVVAYANSRNVSDEVLRLIAANRDFVKLYPVRLALVTNPRTPVSIALRQLGTLTDKDIEALTKNRNVPSAVVAAARRLLAAKAEQQRRREQPLGGH
ncbi:MAG TPA: hypothetical protein VNM66_07790, partial [Thermodesulfobacteriota bacterium]|nr:hypothetical protein [Thermodesulfobacteriota bacterium]